MKFQKAPAHMGKVLTLFVGNGDKRILDDEVLEGAYWQKFVEMGFLVPYEEKAEPEPAKPAAKAAPAPKPEKAPEPAPDPAPDPAPAPESGMTRSTADKMAKAQGKGKSVSTKTKGGKRRKK